MGRIPPPSPSAFGFGKEMNDYYVISLLRVQIREGDKEKRRAGGCHQHLFLFPSRPVPLQPITPPPSAHVWNPFFPPVLPCRSLKIYYTFSLG